MSISDDIFSSIKLLLEKKQGKLSEKQIERLDEDPKVTLNKLGYGTVEKETMVKTFPEDTSAFVPNGMGLGHGGAVYRVFSSSDVEVGDKIKFKIFAETGIYAWIGLYTSAGSRIAYYGKGSSAAAAGIYGEEFTIPENFGYAEINASGYHTIVELGLEKTVSTPADIYGNALLKHEDITVKQDVISDLATIRSNASIGAGLKTKVDEITPVADILKAVYPIGAIYISTVNTSPSTLFGFGTWDRIGEGRTLIDSGNTYTAGNTGGSADAIIPYHTHTFTGSAVNTGNESVGHTHSGTTGNQSANHTHSGTTNNNAAGGSHSHRIPGALTSGNQRGTEEYAEAYGYSGRFFTEASSGTSAHAHGFTTGGVSADHNHGFTTGGVSANHTHSVTASGSNSYVGTEGNTAGANMPPYLAVYMWKRTA